MERSNIIAIWSHKNFQGLTSDELHELATKGSRIRAFHARELSLPCVVGDLRSVAALLNTARERGVHRQRLAEASGLSEKWIARVLMPAEEVEHSTRHI